MINITEKLIKATTVLLIFSSSFAYSQGVGLNATRIIYPAGEKSVSITALNNDPNINYLVQAYITSDENPITFQVMPPLFRLNKLSKHEVKIYDIGNSLPQNRESVFYFHANMVPGQADNDTTSAGLNIGYDNVIKIFYRPKNLSLTSDEAQKGLNFKINGNQLMVTNKSPYYINLASIKVNNTKLDISLAKNNAMIKPYGRIEYSLPKGVANGDVYWRTINDLGGFNDYQAKF